MTIEILRPNAAGDEENIPNATSGAGNHHLDVDDAVADEEDTIVYTNANPGVWTRDLYNLPASSGSGTINKITVYARCLFNGLGKIRLAIKSGATTDESSDITLNPGWAYYYNEWATNPDDSQAWEWADIDNLQIGVNLYAISMLNSWAWCTQVYVEVDYIGPIVITPLTLNISTFAPVVSTLKCAYSAIPPMKVISQNLSSLPGVLQCRLSLVGIPNLLAEDKASKDYFHHWSDTKTVKDMISEIAAGQPIPTELIEEQTEYDSYINIDNTLHGAGQRLTISDRTVTKLAFRMKKAGIPGGNVTFIIYDLLQEEQIASKILGNATSLTTSPVWYEVTFDTPIHIDGDVYMYVEFVNGDASNYVQIYYNSFGVKSNEWFMQVDPEEGPVEFTDADCAYRYKYIGEESGINCFDHCQAYEVVYDDEAKEWFATSLLNTYMPKDAFRIYEGQSRLDKINQLLGYTDFEKRVRADGKIHVFVPKSSEPFDSEYSLESGHVFFSKSVRKALVIPNRIVVKSLRGDEAQYSGEATDPESYALLPISAFIRTKLISPEQATSIAQAMVSRLQVASQRGTASVPMNLGSEVFDYVKVIDSRQDDYRVGNIGYIRRSYKPGTTWRMDFSFGIVPIKRVPGTRPSLLPEARVMPEPTLDEAILRWGMIKPTLEIVESNFGEVWQSFDSIVQILNEILSGLGWLEGKSYDQPETRLEGYLKNVVEDTNPKLGGDLDAQGNNISDISRAYINSRLKIPVGEDMYE